MLSTFNLHPPTLSTHPIGNYMKSLIPKPTPPHGNIISMSQKRPAIDTSQPLVANEQRCIDTLREAHGVVPKQQLIEAVWNIHFDTRTNRLDVLICRLRKRGYPICTHRGIGYSIKDF